MGRGATSSKTPTLTSTLRFGKLARRNLRGFGCLSSPKESQFKDLEEAIDILQSDVAKPLTLRVHRGKGWRGLRRIDSFSCRPVGGGWQSPTPRYRMECNLTTLSHSGVEKSALTTVALGFSPSLPRAASNIGSEKSLRFAKRREANTSAGRWLDISSLCRFFRESSGNEFMQNA